jgi:hypothetical protein
MVGQFESLEKPPIISCLLAFLHPFSFHNSEDPAIADSRVYIAAGKYDILLTLLAAAKYGEAATTLWDNWTFPYSALNLQQYCRERQKNQECYCINSERPYQSSACKGGICSSSERPRRPLDIIKKSMSGFCHDRTPK